MPFSEPRNIDRLISYGVEKIYISVKYLGEQIVDYLGDGSSTTVRFCNSCGPANPLMFWMMSHVLEASMTETLETFGEDIADEIDMELGELNPWGLAEGGSEGESDPYEYMHLCDNGNYVEQWQVNDDWDDCGDNSDEGVVMGSPSMSYDSASDELEISAYFWELMEPTFICGDGSTISFDYVNDNWGDCPDGADEQWLDMGTPSDYSDDCQTWDDSGCTGSEVNWFDCQDNSFQIWIHQVRDGFNDCPDGDDEGLVVYTAEIIVTDNNGNIVTSLLDDVTNWDSSVYSVYSSAGLSSASQVCADVKLDDSYGMTVYTYNYCQHTGMYIDDIDAYDGDGLSIETWVAIQDTSGTTGYTVEISAMEVGSTTTTDSAMHAIDGNSYSNYFEDNLAVTSEGDYVVVVDIYCTRIE